MNLILALKHDCHEALSILTDRVRVYESKIKTYETQCAFKIQNARFELFRRRFYRSLTEEQPMSHIVRTEEIGDFWGMIWNFGMEKYDDTQHNEYLEEFVSGDEVHHTFSSKAEFGKIVSYLSNWKAAGPDGVYTFFIKKCTSLQPDLYKIVRRICLNGEEQDPWFYKGTTYLILKDVPSKGSDFRTITCMSSLDKLTEMVARVMQLDVAMRKLLADNQLGAVT
ncbi:unnamed protein product [Thelazia callipaeda]|uniref:BTB domain-containing protein n=1 Tax=Thelazia callipaeda TaxID=103827 RepID=A0A0N5D0J2_THECL|nr:unnamed protein product [Thelazia callipaeda]